ncbi:hypothetical protein SAMN05444266_10932 [Chitinophaga jiangningensis]|uniref:Uncharacterized protein n=1 Tax=Chitinophaga jiangningensis TaxID=1419482 RepID=A0A1M7JUZ0_9BACT|nr:hypothetical protein [Chitinophaga jiangningensis]SHM56818.1 hypothetical protein SAMN05444266_10932 [Chitinophaga jiangningensis]
MDAPVSLIKANPLQPAEDYVNLRRQGIKHIEELSSDIWTDYNFSDPGITILEAVCYAITDLAYRNGFDMADLLAPEQLSDDTWKNIFYTAREILHNAPLTIDDYRKFIIDVKGVRNAWIEPAKEYEVPVWVDYNAVSLEDHDCGCSEDGSGAKLCYGKLGTIQQSNDQIKENRKKAAAALNERNAAIMKDSQAQEELITKNTALLQNPDIDPYTKATLEAEIEKARTKIEKNKGVMGLIKTALEFLYVDKPVVPPKIVELEGLYKVMIAYEEDVLAEDQREEVRQQVIDRLLKNRNLCEDFLSVDAVEYEDVGVHAAIELEEAADPDQVVADLFFTIYKYFTPSVPFYTIEQMQAKGYLIDEIFEGPALEHGFIDNKDLEKTSLYRDIRLSDIVNEVADIKGIKAINYLHIPADESNNGDARQYFNEWVTLLGAERKIARIKTALSVVVCCKQREMFTYNLGKESDRNPARMNKLFEDRKKLERAYKLQGQQVDFKVPVGEYMNLEDYYPITYSLPMYYGVSDRAGLPSDADQQRQVQALQLRGYLLFFEQLLKEHLVQLNHLRDLYSFDDEIPHTYFTGVVNELEKLSELLMNPKNLPADQPDAIVADFANVLQEITESKETFLERRNIFLNHLLARFAEDMSEYETINGWIAPENLAERMMHDKSRVLKNKEYIKISSNRGKGYNYTKQEIWDTRNVSGAERRVGRLLGFNKISRRSLTPESLVVEASMIVDEKTKLQTWEVNKRNQHLNIIKLIDKENNNKVLLTSVKVVDGCCTDLLLGDIIANADIRLHYQFHDELKQRSRKIAGQLGSFWFELYDGPDFNNAVLLATSERFDTKEEREKAFQRILTLIAQVNDNEGMHVVEHILLRPRLDILMDESDPPRQDDASLLDICLDPCDLGIGLGENTEDPDYWKKVSRIPADKCYDKMPWILEYFRNRLNKTTNVMEPLSVLFQDTYPDGKLPKMLKFRSYPLMAQRIQDLQEFGSERINYVIEDNGKDASTGIKYRFTIYNNKKKVLARSAFLYNKKTQLQEQQGTRIDDDIEEEIKGLIIYFAYLMDWYCKANPCDNNEDPYSFRATVILPCWPKRFRSETYRNFVEKTIQTEFPAHIVPRIEWVGISQMQQFEKVYQGWLLEIAQTEMPGYEKMDPLVDTLNHIVPCGSCEEDCSND